MPVQTRSWPFAVEAANRLLSAYLPRPLHELHHCFEQPVTRLQPYRCPGYIAHYDVYSLTRRADIDGRRRTELGQTLFVGHAFPRLLRHLRIRLGGLYDCFADLVDQRV